MKSLLISSVYFPPKIGGISHLMRGIASALGPDRVCCLTGQPETASVGNGVAPKVYRRPAAFNGNRLRRAFNWGPTIAEIMLRERPQAVQIATASEGSMALWLRRWLKLPFVVYAHGNEILDMLDGKMQNSRLALQRANRVLAVSSYTASLVEKLGIAPRRIEIVHPGCDIDRFQALSPRMDLRRKLLGSRSGDRVILSVGALVERKGHDMVIRALPRLLKTIPEVTYLIVGNGPCRGRLETLAAEAGVRDRVVFAGRMLDEQMSDIYALSNVFAMPSREILETGTVEGFGLVFLEAAACGKPAVGGRSGGVPDAVVDGVTGLLVDPEDPGEIATALVRLLADNDLALRLGEQARLRVVSDFNWTGVADRVQGILDSVVEENSMRRTLPRLFSWT
jgi:phosphatidylinositol alpha-1,6-mannosyltransferase